MKDSNSSQLASRAGRQTSLSDRLASLESQIERLTQLLAQQATIRQRRRQRLTIRLMLSLFVVFAIGFAWFGNVYHRSRKQARSVDRLIAQSAFVSYTVRQNPLVSLMPGDPQQPPVSLVRWLGDDFFSAVTNVSTASAGSMPVDKEEVLAAVESLDRLQRLRLTHMRLSTADLAGLEHLLDLQSLDISRTGLDHGSIPWVRTSKLRWFDASHTHLSDRALYDLSHCRELQQLMLERTSISDNGLRYLQSLKQLRYLNLNRCPVSAAAVKQLSDALPGCVIDWQPLKFLANGKVDSRAAARGRVRYGRPMPEDPRLSRRAAPPIDNGAVPVAASPASQRWQVQTLQPYSGYFLETF